MGGFPGSHTIEGDTQGHKRSKSRVNKRVIINLEVLINIR